jgi:hypothetical protein
MNQRYFASAFLHALYHTTTKREFIYIQASKFIYTEGEEYAFGNLLYYSEDS